MNASAATAWNLGKLKFLNTKFGFISTDEGDIYVARSDWDDVEPAPGVSVVFELGQNAKGKCALWAHIAENLHRELWTMHTDTVFCPVCGGFTPWTKEAHAKSGGMTHVSFDEDGDVEVSRTIVTYHGYCIHCHRQEAADKSRKSEATLEEAKALEGQEFLIKDSVFKEGSWQPVYKRIRLGRSFMSSGDVNTNVDYIPPSTGVGGPQDWKWLRLKLLNENHERVFAE